MALKKAFLELYGVSSRKLARIVEKNTGLGAYIIDGKVSDAGGISCNGNDYKAMQDLCIAKELSNKISQPTLFFFFTKSSTLIMNFASAHAVGLSSSPMAMGGIFSPVECVLDEAKPNDPTTMCGEILYDGKTIYVLILGWHRGIASNNVSTDINNLPMEAVDLSKYSYDIDSKTSAKTVTSNKNGWAFGGITAQAKKYNMTDEYIYKYTQDSSKILNLSSTTGQVQHDNSFASADKESTYYSAQMNMNGDPHPLGQFSSSSNIDSGLFTTATDIVSDYLTKDNVASKFYAFYPYMQMGISKIYEINDTFTSTTLLTDKNAYVSPKGMRTDTLNEYDNNGVYIATSDISGEYLLIKTQPTPCITYSGKSPAYKVKNDGDYIVVTSKSSANTENQANFMYEPYLAYKNNQLACAGRLVSVADNNNKPFSGSMHVGLNFRCLVRQFTDVYCNLMVLYDDGSSAISGLLTSTIRRNAQRDQVKYSNVPVEITEDGLNVIFSNSVTERSYENATDIFKNPLSDNVLGFIENDFCVIKNNGTKKIIALGIIYSSRFFDQIGIPENAGNPLDKESAVLLLSNIKLPKVPPFDIPSDAKDYDIDHPRNRILLLPPYSLDQSKNTVIDLETGQPSGNLYFRNGVKSPPITNIDPSGNAQPLPVTRKPVLFEYPTKALSLYDSQIFYGTTPYQTRYFNIMSGRVVISKSWNFNYKDITVQKTPITEAQTAYKAGYPVTIGRSISFFDGTTWLYEKFYGGVLITLRHPTSGSYYFTLTGIFEDDTTESVSITASDYLNSLPNYVGKFNIFAGGKQLKYIRQADYNTGFFDTGLGRYETYSTISAYTRMSREFKWTPKQPDDSLFQERSKRIKKLLIYFKDFNREVYGNASEPGAVEKAVPNVEMFLYLKNK